MSCRRPARLHGWRRRNLVSEAARYVARARATAGRAVGTYPAEEMTAWRVADDAKNGRIDPHPGDGGTGLSGLTVTTGYSAACQNAPRSYPSSI